MTTQTKCFICKRIIIGEKDYSEAAKHVSEVHSEALAKALQSEPARGHRE